MNYFFTADEHYGHGNIIRYCDRPFHDIEEMNETLINNHNSVVSDSSNNLTVHCGDFHWARKYSIAQKVIERLNGKHVFLMGSHDVWLKSSPHHERWEKNINGQVVVADHYAGRVWSRSHRGSWQVYGHSHGNLESFGKSYDVGVDNNQYYPLSFDELCVIMATLDDNFNLLRK